jgi:hypothetical protein
LGQTIDIILSVLSANPSGGVLVTLLREKTIFFSVRKIALKNKSYLQRQLTRGFQAFLGSPDFWGY